MHRGPATEPILSESRLRWSQNSCLLELERPVLILDGVRGLYWIDTRDRASPIIHEDGLSAAYEAEVIAEAILELGNSGFLHSLMLATYYSYVKATFACPSYGSLSKLRR